MTLCAYGSASKVVSGQTLHSAFNLFHKSSNFEDLAKKFKVTKALKEKFNSISVIFLDEIYVLSPSFLQFINIALQKILLNKQPFGNLSIIALGDLSQLPPVAQHSLWSSAKMDKFSVEGLSLYKTEFKKVFWLSEAMRHKDIKLRDLAYRVRTKTVTDADLLLLKQRCASNLDRNVVQGFHDAIRIYPTNEELKIYNNKKLQELKMPTIWLKPVQSPSGPPFVHEKILEFPICLGAKVSLTRNLDIVNWLTNNTEGIVEGILFDSDDLKTPSIIFVRFFNTKNKTINGLTPISMVTENIGPNQVSCTKYKIKFFPLRLAWGVSVHKSQGKTFEKVAIKLGKRDLFPAQAYVTISRAVSLTNLLIEENDVVFDRFTNITFFNGFEDLCQEYKRLGIFHFGFPSDLNTPLPNKKRKFEDAQRT